MRPGLRPDFGAAEMPFYLRLGRPFSATEARRRRRCQSHVPKMDVPPAHTGQRHVKCCVCFELRDTKYLSREDLVRIVKHWLVRFEYLWVAVAVAVRGGGDCPECVAWFDDVHL